MPKEDITTSQDFNIRYTTALDGIYLKKWLLEPGMLHWFYLKTEAEVSEFVKVWMSFIRLKCCLTATYKGAPCALGALFLMPYLKVAHQAQGLIVVDPLYQRKGVGTSLVKNLSHLAKDYFSLEKIHYEIFGSNPLIDLLKKQGFYEVFKQEKFIKEGYKEYLARTFMEIDFGKKG